MPKGYVIVRAEVTNPEKWAEYVTKSKVALEKFGGKPIVRGGKAEIVEGDGLPRNVVLEFDSFEKAQGYAISRRIRRGQEGAPGRRHAAHGRRRGHLSSTSSRNGGLPTLHPCPGLTRARALPGVRVVQLRACQGDTSLALTCASQGEEDS